MGTSWGRRGRRVAGSRGEDREREGETRTSTFDLPFFSFPHSFFPLLVPSSSSHLYHFSIPPSLAVHSGSAFPPPFHLLFKHKQFREGTSRKRKKGDSLFSLLTLFRFDDGGKTMTTTRKGGCFALPLFPCLSRGGSGGGGASAAPPASTLAAVAPQEKKKRSPVSSPLSSTNKNKQTAALPATMPRSFSPLFSNDLLPGALSAIPLRASSSIKEENV